MNLSDTPPAAGHALRDSRSPAAVLVVDDDPTILESVADTLRLAGYHPVTAENGLQALQRMQEVVPDVIVADIAMPEMDGYRLHQAIRHNPAWALIPFIFLTARGQPSDIRLGYSLGADHYLTKPIDPEDLLVAVESRLQRVAEMRAAAQGEVDRMKSHIMTVMGHELRSPLSIIYGYLHLLEESRDDLDAETLDQALGEMRQGASRLVKLVEDLLLMVYIDSGAIDLEIARHRQPVNLSLEVQQIVQDLSPVAHKNGISVATEVPYDLAASGIPSYVSDVIRRLVDNAIKFGRPGVGHVWITAEREGDYVSVSVRDDGIGIAPESLALLFVPMQQIDRERMEQQGAGLGLAIARSLAQRQGGDIQVHSVPGAGSTFTVRLPASDPAVGLG